MEYFKTQFISFRLTTLRVCTLSLTLYKKIDIEFDLTMGLLLFLFLNYAT